MSAKTLIIRELGKSTQSQSAITYLTLIKGILDECVEGKLSLKDAAHTCACTAAYARELINWRKDPSGQVYQLRTSAKILRDACVNE